MTSATEATTLDESYFAFLFRGDDGIADMPQRMLAALVDQAASGTSILTSVRVGAVLLASLAYRPTAIERGDDGRMIRSTETARPDVWAFLLSALNSYLTHAEAHVDVNQVVGFAQRHTLESFSVGPISADVAAAVAADLSDLDSCLGYTPIDLGNPIFRKVFWTGLMDSYQVHGTELAFIDSDWGNEDARWNIADPESWVAAVKATAAFWISPFCDTHNQPVAAPEVEMSEMGRNHFERYTRMTQPTPLERVVVGLSAHDAPPSAEAAAGFRFDALQVPRGSAPNVPEQKVRGYLLNKDHKKGGSKAKLFESALGIVQDDWRFLAVQLEQGLAGAPVLKVRYEKYGVKFEVITSVRGRNGKIKPLLSAWIVRAEEPPAFVTAYLANPGREADAPPIDVAVLPVGSEADWEALWRVASLAADQASERMVPTPMHVVTETWDGEAAGPEWWIDNGAEGVATVRVRDARTGFARWLMESGHASRGYRSGAYIYAPPRGVEPATVWAETFAEILRWHNVAAEVVSHLT